MQKDLLSRISTDCQVMKGKPVIKETRRSVEYSVNLLAQGETIKVMLEQYQKLTKKDIYAYLLFSVIIFVRLRFQ